MTVTEWVGWAERTANGCARSASEIASSILLAELPIEIDALRDDVSHALKVAERTLIDAAGNNISAEQCASSSAAAAVSCLCDKAAAAADAARESTFPYLGADVVEPAYNAAYAVASLLYAAALLLRASSNSTNGLAEAVKTDAAGALRALDLAMLRGGVDEWGVL